MDNMLQAIWKLMVNIYPPINMSKICDPCGGDGGLLRTAVDVIDHFNPENIYYYDINDETTKSAIRAFTIYQRDIGHNTQNIQYSNHDSLADEWHGLMDRIYTDAPFYDKVTSPDILNNYKVGRNKTSELSQILLIEKCIRQLNDCGAFIIIVDKGVVTNMKYMSERVAIAKMAALELIVELIGDTATAPTYLLCFRKIRSSYTRYEKVEYPYTQCRDIITRWHDRDWPDVADPNHDYDYTTTLTGNWLWGYWKYLNIDTPRLRDFAELVIENWEGYNNKNPTVDRQYKYIKETHLSPNPATKTRSLKKDCILLNRLLVYNQPPSCGIIDDEYDGAGCTHENYIIRAKDPSYTSMLWYLINFDIDCHEYLWSHCRGKNRGRITDLDLLGMPIRQLTASEIQSADVLLDVLNKKLKVDKYVDRQFARHRPHNEREIQP